MKLTKGKISKIMKKKIQTMKKYKKKTGKKGKSRTMRRGNKYPHLANMTLKRLKGGEPELPGLPGQDESNVIIDETQAQGKTDTIPTPPPKPPRPIKKVTLDELRDAANSILSVDKEQPFSEAQPLEPTTDTIVDQKQDMQVPTTLNTIVDQEQDLQEPTTDTIPTNTIVDQEDLQEPTTDTIVDQEDLQEPTTIVDQQQKPTINTTEQQVLTANTIPENQAQLNQQQEQLNQQKEQQQEQLNVLGTIQSALSDLTKKIESYEEENNKYKLANPPSLTEASNTILKYVSGEIAKNLSTDKPYPQDSEIAIPNAAYTEAQSNVSPEKKSSYSSFTNAKEKANNLFSNFSSRFTQKKTPNS